MSVELPRDAEGREIPLDTVALFNRVGNVYSIVRWTFTTDFDLSDGWSNKWRAITDRGFALDPALVYLTTPDTWEKLEEDLGRGADALNYEACAYFGKSACDCSSCIADKGETCERIVMTKRAMISQPMAGKTDEEIAKARDKAHAKLREMGYEFVNTLFTDEWYSDEAMEERGVVQVPLCYLAKSLENMSLCHTAYFCKGWEDARGCRIEHDAAVAYGLEVLYED